MYAYFKFNSVIFLPYESQNLMQKHLCETFAKMVVAVYSGLSYSGKFCENPDLYCFYGGGRIEDIKQTRVFSSRVCHL